MIGLNRIFKIAFSFLLICSSLFLTSCKSSDEVNNLGIVVSVGFDLEGEEVIITNEVINPMGISSANGSDTQETTEFVISRGKTIEEAIYNTSLTFDRKLYYPHAHTIILGEEVVKEGLDGYIDMLSRNNQIRETSLIIVAKDAKAYEIMGINSGLSNSPGRYLHQISEENVTTGKQRALDINRFFRYLYRKNEGYVLGVAEKINKKTVSPGGKVDNIEVLSAEGGAVLKGKSLVGYFTGEEMIGFNFIVNEFKEGTIAFETSEDVIEKSDIKDNNTKHYSSFKVFRSKTKRDIKLEKDKLHLYIDIKLRGTLKATQEEVDLNNPATIKTLEEGIEKTIKKATSNTLEKAKKEFGVDTFSIGELVHKNYPDLWREIEENWTEIFKDIDYTINVNAKINDVGFTNTTKGIRKSIYEK